jgi:hypothetical protein
MCVMTKEIRINVRTSEQIKRDLEITAELRGLTVSALVNSLVVKAIREEKEREPHAFYQLPEVERHPPEAPPLDPLDPALYDGIEREPIITPPLQSSGQPLDEVVIIGRPGRRRKKEDDEAPPEAPPKRRAG